MKEIKGSELEQLGQDTVAQHLAKAEGTTIDKAKEKLKEAKEQYFEEKKTE